MLKLLKKSEISISNKEVSVSTKLPKLVKLFEGSNTREKKHRKQCLRMHKLEIMKLQHNNHVMYMKSSK